MYEEGGVNDDELPASMMPSSFLIGVEEVVEIAVRGLSSEGNVIVLGVWRGGRIGLFVGAMVTVMGRAKIFERVKRKSRIKIERRKVLEQAARKYRKY